MAQDYAETSQSLYLTATVLEAWVPDVTLDRHIENRLKVMRSELGKALSSLASLEHIVTKSEFLLQLYAEGPPSALP